MPGSKKLAEKNKIKLILVLAGLVVLIIAGGRLFLTLKPKPPAQSPKVIINQPSDLSGFYKGDLPCADCSGITETLILANDHSYILEDVYQGKSVKPFQTQGRWELINSNILKLNPSDKSQVSYFRILENKNLQMLDSNMQKIDSPFNQTLNKV